MANHKYHNEAVKAFQFLDEALRPFVKQEMFAVYQDNWLRNIATEVRWERGEPIWDTLALLHTIRVNWVDVFKMDRLRSPEERGKVSALIDWRHRILAHSDKPLDKNDAGDAIRSIHHLLTQIRATAQVKEVEQILVVFQQEVPNIPLAHVDKEVEAELQRLESIVSSAPPQLIPVIATPIPEVIPSKPFLPFNTIGLRLETAETVEEVAPVKALPLLQDESYGKSIFDKLVRLGTPIYIARNLETVCNEDELLDRVGELPQGIIDATLDAIYNNTPYQPHTSKETSETSRIEPLSQKAKTESALSTPAIETAVTRPPLVYRARQSAILEDIEEADITDPVVLLRIDRSYRFGIPAAELYEATRGDWVMTPDKRSIKPRYAMAVVSFIIREVYIIDGWRPVPTSPWGPGRWQFDGTVASDKTGFIGKSVQSYINRRSSNPVRYVNC